MFKAIVVTIDRFEGEFAVLKHKDHEMLWPKEDLPNDSAEGSVITLTAMNEKQVEADRTGKAKLILNDILNSAIGTDPGVAPFDEESRKEIERDQRKELHEIQNQIERLNDNLSK